MSQNICIPCFNDLQNEHRFLVHRFSRAKCSICGKKMKQGLHVTYDDNYTCDHPEGCDHTEIVWRCPLGALKECPKE